MNDQALSFEAQRSTLQAQRMFRRMLAAWASDVLRLRKIGLDRPVHIEPTGDAPPSWRQAA